METPVLFLSQRSGFALASPVNIRDPFIGTGSLGIHNAPAERLFGKEFSFQAVSGIFKGEGFLAFCRICSRTDDSIFSDIEDAILEADSTSHIIVVALSGM